MVTMLAGIMGLVATEMVENDNDTDKGTNMGRVKVFYSYFVRWVYVFRYPTAHSCPCKLTSKILALSVVENIFFWVATATPLGTYDIVT